MRGRPLGSRDKQPRKRRAVVLEPVRGDGSPLNHLLDVMRDESVPPHRRDKAAIAAASFMHPRATFESGKKAVAEALSRTIDLDSDWAPLLRRGRTN